MNQYDPLPSVNACMRILRAVFEYNLNIYLNPPKIRCPKNRYRLKALSEEIEEARSWFFDDSPDAGGGVFSFDSVAYHLGYDPGWLRHGVAQAKERAEKGEPFCVIIERADSP